VYSLESSRLAKKAHQKAKGPSVVANTPKRVSLSSKSGLLLAPSKFKNLLKVDCYNNPRVGPAAAVSLAATTEYLMAELLELAAQATKSSRKKSITTRHLMLAVASDDELSTLFKGFQSKAAGVVPHIHPTLVQKTKQKPRKKKTAAQLKRDADRRAQNTRAVVAGPTNAVTPRSGGAPRVARRARPGVRQMQLIKQLQKSTDLLTSKAAWQRAVKENIEMIVSSQEAGGKGKDGGGGGGAAAAANIMRGMSVSQEASAQLRLATESHLVALLRAGNLAALHAKRTGVMPKDLQLVRHVTQRDMPY
jgi:histone H3/H4